MCFLIGPITGAMLPAAEILPPPPITRPADTGVIRLWGNAETGALVARWRESFSKSSAPVRLETHLTGSDVAMGALATGAADIALLGREATAAEVKAFEWVFRYQPLRIEVATGSVGAPGKSPALALYVHRDNPLRRLTLAQVDALFGREFLRGAPHALEKWDDLGLSGDFSGRAISLYAPDTESGTGRFFREAALGGSRKLAWERLTEFADTRREAQPTHDATPQTLAALARDRFGLAVAAAGSTRADVRLVPLASADGGPDFLPTPESLISRRYPLTRTLVAYVNCKPGTPLDARLAAFLRHALGEAGQRDISAAGGYLPLSPATLAEQRAKLFP
jgi:phosphate transport system substrate-binding protein